MFTSSKTFHKYHGLVMGCVNHIAAPFRIYVPCGETVFPLCYIELIKAPQHQSGSDQSVISTKPFDSLLLSSDGSGNIV